MGITGADTGGRTPTPREADTTTPTREGRGCLKGVLESLAARLCRLLGLKRCWYSDFYLSDAELCALLGEGTQAREAETVPIVMRMTGEAFLRILPKLPQELAVHISTRKLAVTETMWFSIWPSRLRHDGKDYSAITVASDRALSYLPLGVACPPPCPFRFPCRNSTTSNSGKTIG